jgi:hypothetical protein
VCGANELLKDKTKYHQSVVITLQLACTFAVGAGQAHINRVEHKSMAKQQVVVATAQQPVTQR